jgi:hypothetical protein
VPDCDVDVFCGGSLIGTANVIADSLLPVWTEEFHVTNYNQGDELDFEVHAKDSTRPYCLGKVAMTPERFATDGFNDEVLLEDTAANIQACMSLKIKPMGKPYPAGPPSTFTVEVEKGENEDYGLVLDGSDGKHIIVHGIDAGAFADYNKSVEPSQQLKKTDFIVLVNGVSVLQQADCAKQFQESKVKCVVTRGTEFSLILERENLEKPLGLVFPARVRKQGYGLPITSISHSSAELDKLQAHDRIVSVNGETGRPVDLLAKMENTTGKFQVRVLRARLEKGSDLACHSDEHEVQM